MASLLVLSDPTHCCLSACLSVCIAHESLWHCRGVERGRGFGFSWATEGCCCCEGPQLAATVLTDEEHTVRSKVEHTHTTLTKLSICTRRGQTVARGPSEASYLIPAVTIEGMVLIGSHRYAVFQSHFNKELNTVGGASKTFGCDFALLHFY